MTSGTATANTGSWLLDSAPDGPFARLRALLDSHAPGGPPDREPVALTIGEPKHAIPDLVPEVLSRSMAEFGRYPVNEGTPELRAAIAGWLERRYGLGPEDIDPAKQILPLNGTREGLFNAALACVTPRSDGPRPAVLMPNPFYQCYAAAALAAGAEPVYLSATAATGHLPDLDALPAELLERTAAFYVCSPANPQGAVASAAYWGRLLDLAERYGFAVLADECYAEIYDASPPPGVLEVKAKTGNAARVLAFHSLSKRSNLPGLRSGFVAGDAELIARMTRLRTLGGAPLPGPLQAVAAAVWAEEAHVAENRRLYREKFDVAERVLANRLPFERPQAGFFLWLDVSGCPGIEREAGLTAGEQAALILWKDAGVRVLPGAYLSRTVTHPDGPAKTREENPGADYIRIALVHDAPVVEEALTRLAETLTAAPPSQRASGAAQA